MTAPPHGKFLAGQPALVTGAASGIGRAIALALAAAGADIVVNHLTEKPDAEDLAQEIEALGQKAIVIQADVSNEENVERMFRMAIAHFGTLHIAVANAGLQLDAPFTDMHLEQWNRALSVNLTGQFLCMKAAAKEFGRRGVVTAISRAAGKIVCISSVHQKVAWAGHANYAASKGGVMMLMRSVAQELAPKRIRVNAIAPGAIRTPINRAAWETSQALASLESLIPYGRIGEVEDIAQAATWLVSDASDYMTGATLTIDGGLSLNLQTTD